MAAKGGLAMSKERVKTLRAGIATLLAAGVAICVVTVMPAAAQDALLSVDVTNGTATLLPGSKIAFHGDRQGRDEPDEIYVMSAADPERRLTPDRENKCNAINPRWSRNGHRIAFHCFILNVPDPSNKNFSEIYVINADKTGITPLTDMKAGEDVGECPLNTCGAAFASWSPNGKKIAFSSANPLIRDFVPHIYVVDVDDCIAAPAPCRLGAGVTRLTSLEANRPDWSPDGLKLVFNRGPQPTAQIYVADINDPDVAVQLTFPGGANRNPRWSPDGSKITFESTRDGNPEIYVMNADGSGQLRLTDSPDAPNNVPSFSPDGHWIVFHRQLFIIPGQRSPNGSDLFVVPVDRSLEAVRLTTKAPDSFSSFASWAPGHYAITPTH